LGLGILGWHALSPEPDPQHHKKQTKLLKVSMSRTKNSLNTFQIVEGKKQKLATQKNKNRGHKM
jgi:hypothetical protein